MNCSSSNMSTRSRSCGKEKMEEMLSKRITLLTFNTNKADPVDIIGHLDDCNIIILQECRNPTSVVAKCTDFNENFDSFIHETMILLWDKRVVTITEPARGVTILDPNEDKPPKPNTLVTENYYIIVNFKLVKYSHILFQFYGVHGNPTYGLSLGKKEFKDKKALETCLGDFSRGRWVIMGDFNLTFEAGDGKKLERSHITYGPKENIGLFKEFLKLTGAKDLQASNATFTHGSNGKPSIESKLDRIVYSKTFESTFSLINSGVQPTGSSNHKPVKLRLFI